MSRVLLLCIGLASCASRSIQWESAGYSYEVGCHATMPDGSHMPCLDPDWLLIGWGDICLPTEATEAL